MIDSFQGNYRFLSNFWPARVELGDVYYPTVEHDYQAAKTNDLSIRAAIRKNPNPANAKKLGRRLTIREDWDLFKIPVMRDLLAQKFAPQSDLAAALLATGEEMLVEGTTWGDTFWGICKGVGENQLGRLLMEQRDWLRSI